MQHPIRHLLMLCACLAGLLASPARAQTLSDILQAEILPGWRTENGTHMAAIRLKLAGGWKTYWRSPGDAGIPPEISWAGSENVAAVKILWPTPEVFNFNGMQSIGYSHEVVLPVEIQPRNAGQDVRLHTGMDIGVCRDICVPARVDLTSILLPAGRPDPEIRSAMRARPATARSAGITAARCALIPAPRGGLQLQVDLTMPRLGSAEVMAIESNDPMLWISDAVTKRRGDQLHGLAEIAAVDHSPVNLNRSGLRITVIAGGKAAEVIGCQGS